MASYEVLDTYKQKLKKMFLQNQNLQKLIYYNVDNPLAQDNLLNPNVLFKGETITENGQLVKKDPVILFKNKNYKTVSSRITFVLIEILSTPIYKSKAFKEFEIMITIACHNEIEELYDGRNRVWMIKDEIDDYLNGNKYLGIGKCRDSGEKKIDINDDFSGTRLIYSINARSMNYRNENR